MILYEDHYKRGRADGEIIDLFRQGMQGTARVKKVEEVQGALKAVETALKLAAPETLLVIQADAIDETVSFIRKYLEARTPASPGRRNRGGSCRRDRRYRSPRPTPP